MVIHSEETSSCQVWRRRMLREENSVIPRGPVCLPSSPGPSSLGSHPERTCSRGPGQDGNALLELVTEETSHTWRHTAHISWSHVRLLSQTPETRGQPPSLHLPEMHLRKQMPQKDKQASVDRSPSRIETHLSQTL